MKESIHNLTFDIAGTPYTMYSEKGEPLMFHPSIEALKRSCLYVDETTTPIKKGYPKRKEKNELPVPDMPDS